MTVYSYAFWTELTGAQQSSVMTQFGGLDVWMTMQRFRPSSIAVAWSSDTPVALSVVSHDRVRVGVALIDVATVRYTTKASTQSDEVIVELLMYQAQSLLDEGIGIVLVHGDVAFWSKYGFAPICMDVETRWLHAGTSRAIEPGRTRIGLLSLADVEIIRGIARTQLDNDVSFVEEAVVNTSEWLQLYGRDGQLRAAAQLTPQSHGMFVKRAVATDDGAAYELVSALIAHVGDATKLGLQLSQHHAVTRMAQEQRAHTRVASASTTTMLAGVIDLPKMLEALKPAFRNRILASEYADWQGGVRVEISDERAMIMFDRGAVSVIDGTREASLRIKQVEVHALAQMAFGYRSIGALRRAGMLYCDDTELRLCETIFPYLAPVLEI